MPACAAFPRGDSILSDDFLLGEISVPLPPTASGADPRMWDFEPRLARAPPLALARGFLVEAVDGSETVGYIN